MRHEDERSLPGDLSREMDYQSSGLHLIYTPTPLWHPIVMADGSGCWQMQRVEGRCLPLLACSLASLTQLAGGGSLGTVIALDFEPISTQINCFWFSYL